MNYEKTQKIVFRILTLILLIIALVGCDLFFSDPILEVKNTTPYYIGVRINGGTHHLTSYETREIDVDVDYDGQYVNFYYWAEGNGLWTGETARGAKFYRGETYRLTIY